MFISFAGFASAKTEASRKTDPTAQVETSGKKTVEAKSKNSRRPNQAVDLTGDCFEVAARAARLDFTNEGKGGIYEAAVKSVRVDRDDVATSGQTIYRATLESRDGVADIYVVKLNLAASGLCTFDSMTIQRGHRN